MVSVVLERRLAARTKEEYDECIMTKKIFVTRAIPENGIALLKQKGYIVDIYPKDKILKQKSLIKILKKGSYDAVLSLLTDKIDRSVFDAAPSVKLYANYATGFDNIDVVEAKKRGIAVANAPTDSSSEAVAEHTIALMLALAAKVVEADDFVRRGKYKGWAPMNFVGTNLFGKTLGLVGAGRIGERVAFYAKGLGLSIVYMDTRANETLEHSLGARKVDSLDELLRSADIVSLHVPLLPTTHHLIGAPQFGIMKKSAFLVNTARGPVIDERALCDALKRNVIAGAGLDVFEFEPKLVSGLARCNNVILTPHIASASIEAREDMAVVSAQTIIDFFEGRTPAHLV